MRTVLLVLRGKCGSL